MILPILASTEDAVQITQFLKTRATGCTIVDAKAIIDKKLLDPRKINAYMIWKLISRDGDKLKLTELGKRLARAEASQYCDIFSEILHSVEAYHCALEWAFYQKDLTQVTNVDIAAYWYETKKFSLDTENENTLKDMAVCFFRLCDGAGIGKLTIGRRGQATRLDINRDQLGQYIGGSSLTQQIEENYTDVPETVPEKGRDDEAGEEAYSDIYEAPSPLSSVVSPTENSTRIFISHGKNMEIVEQIKTLIELANLDYEVVVETETSAIPIPEKVFGAMRRCNSAVICVSADDNDKKEDGSYGVNQNVLIEIGSAFVLYDKKVILVWDKRIPIPSNLQGLYRCEFTGDELSWGTGIKLMKALNNFKKN